MMSWHCFGLLSVASCLQNTCGAERRRSEQHETVYDLERDITVNREAPISRAGEWFPCSSISRQASTVVVDAHTGLSLSEMPIQVRLLKLDPLLTVSSNNTVARVTSACRDKDHDVLASPLLALLLRCRPQATAGRRDNALS